MAGKQGSKPGERRGGRKVGSKNKAVVEREARALKELAERAMTAQASGKKFVIAKDELLDLIPVVKDTVAEFQKAAIGVNGSGMPGRPKFDPEKWDRFKDWIEMLAKFCKDAADYQSPKFRAIAVQMTQDLPQAPKTIEADLDDDHGREQTASAAYLKLVKG